MAIEWIDRTVRVPPDRREVLIWGKITSHPVDCWTEPRFLGVSRCNILPHGHDRFDREGSSIFFSCHVTHWAEIEGPSDAA